ncbi:MAG: hypothetical protein KDB07_01270 [Planctomycetes bacterium]|nr:hypothetical protein [Planctomycetota bacterium]
MPELRFDHKNLLASAVGSSHGLTNEELDAVLARHDKYQARLRKGMEEGQLGFLSIVDDEERLASFQAFAERRRGSFTTLLVIGVGGSILGLQAVHAALKTYRHAGPEIELRSIDNTDPSTILQALSGLKPEQTLTLVISKSGGTLDTLTGLAVVDDWYRRANLPLERHLVAVHGEKPSFLSRYANERKLTTFVQPDNVGGRFSALCAVGALPMCLLGYDGAGVVAGARAMRDHLLSCKALDNGALINAGAQVSLARDKGKTVSVVMPYASRLRTMGDWYVQLWAESLGKNRDLENRPTKAGQHALVGVGATSQHSMLQLLIEGPNSAVTTFIEVEAFETELALPTEFPWQDAGAEYLSGRRLDDIIRAQLVGTVASLTEASRPNATITLPRVTPATLGELLMFFEVQTAFAAYFWNVNAFDQPAVERGKAITRERLAGG